MKEKGSSLFPAAISMQIFCARVSLRLPIENSMGRTFPQRERERSSYLWWKKIQGREKPVVFILLLLFAVRAECCGGGGEEREVRTARRLRGLHLSKVPRISIYSTKGAQGATIPILTHHVHHHPPKGIRPDQQRWNLASSPRFSVWFAAGFTSLKENKWTVKECSLLFSISIGRRRQLDDFSFVFFILFLLLRVVVVLGPIKHTLKPSLGRIKSSGILYTGSRDSYMWTMLLSAFPEWFHSRVQNGILPQHALLYI